MRPILVISLTAVASLGLSSPLAANLIEGSAAAIDGDTLDMTGTRVRLAHIDAPEARQGCETNGALWACGEEAGRALAVLVRSATVSCRALERDVYGREVAVCQSGAFDLGEELIRRGMAVASADAPEHYHAMESLAKRTRTGIWGSDFRLPSEWRAANRQPAPPPPAAPAPVQASRHIASRSAEIASAACTIKGNRNRKGEWIYHLPGRPYYAQTRAEEMFCSEAEARAAGYRRSRA